MKHIESFDEVINENILKKEIDNIKTISEFVDVINSITTTPQRGFSYKPDSAKKISNNELLIHSTSKENIIPIIQNGFNGVGAYYSSFTKKRKNAKHISGDFAFAFDLKNKKVDSRFQNKFLYGSWAIIFKSDDACKVYNTGDKQFQVMFDVNKNIDILCVVNYKIDMNNMNERIWDIYDTELNLIRSDIKLIPYLKTLKKL